VSDTNDSETTVSIRRVPKFSVFIVGGAVLGELITVILTLSFPADPSVGIGPLLGYFSIYGLTGGVLFGAILSIVLDRVLARRAKTLTATVATLEPAEDAAAIATETDLTAE
jgi:hypothetical protein